MTMDEISFDMDEISFDFMDALEPGCAANYPSENSVRFVVLVRYSNVGGMEKK